MARSGVLYGSTGSFKTTQAKYFARYIAKKTGKATCLLNLDGGGWGACQPEIDAGMIIPCRIDSGRAPVLYLRKFSQGFWPAKGRQAEDGELVPLDYNLIGGYVVEGWTSLAAAIMRYLPDKGINVGGEDRSKLGGFEQSVTVGGRTVSESFRSNTRGDFGFAQNALYGMVMNWNSLPLEYVLYTALEAKTEDDDRSTIYGPAIAGKKATAQCGAWVGDMIHAQDYQTVETIKVPDPAKPGATMDQQITKVICRYYFMKHPDPATGIPFPAKPRVTPEKVGELMKRYPGGYFEPKADGTDAFGQYLELVDQLNADATGGDQGLKAWREQMDKRLGRTTGTPQPSVPATIGGTK